MAQIASKAASNEIMRALFGDLTGSRTGSGGGGLGSILGSLFGSGKAMGGPITRRAGGGAIPMTDAATAGRDSQLTWTTPGEYVLRRSAVDVIGRETLDRMNAMGAGVMAKAPPVDRERFGNSARAETAVYVVDRDQVPVPTHKDIVYAIGDDIQRGGAIKTLIKRTVAGG